MNGTEQPLKVLHLIKTSVGATWAWRLTRELVKLGVEVHAAMSPGPRVADYEEAGVIVHKQQFDIPMRAPWRWPGLFGALSALVDKVQPDIIHSHFVGTTLTMRLALGRRHLVPRVFEVPGPLHLEHRFFRTAELATASRKDYWIATCTRTRELYLRLGVSSDRVFLSYYGVDLDRYPLDPPQGKLRQELGIGADVKVVGMVAYIYAPKRYLLQQRGLKGHEDLIDALAICLQHDENILGVFVGGAWKGAYAYERRIQAYARRCCGDKAVFLGTRYDVPELYADFDVAVHPSHSENIGGAVESLLFGIPTIATDVGGFPDLVRPDETGWLVKPRDPKMLAGMLMAVLADLPAARAKALQGRALASDLLDVRKNAREVYAAYRTILDREQQSAHQ